MLLCALCSPAAVDAAQITLRSGRVIEGKIIEETSHHVKVYSSSGLRTYYAEDVSNIDGHKLGVSSDSSRPAGDNQQSKNISQNAPASPAVQPDQPVPQASAPPKKDMPGGQEDGLIKKVLPGGGYALQNYANGVLEGKTSIYDNSGQLTQEQWFKNGNLALERNYVKGVLQLEVIHPHGSYSDDRTEKRYENGNIQSQYVYENGKLASVAYYDDHGQLITPELLAKTALLPPPQKAADNGQVSPELTSELLGIHQRYVEAMHAGNIDATMALSSSRWIEKRKQLDHLVSPGFQHIMLKAASSMMGPVSNVRVTKATMLGPDRVSLEMSSSNSMHGNAEFVKEDGQWKIDSAQWTNQ